MPDHLEDSTTIAAEPDAVWELIADARRRPEWMPEVRVVSTNDRALEKGDRFEGVSQLLGHGFVGVSEVTESVEGVSLAERVVIGARVSSRWTVSAAATGGSNVTQELTIDFPSGALGRVERRLLLWRLRRLQRQSLVGLAKSATS